MILLVVNQFQRVRAHVLPDDLSPPPGVVESEEHVSVALSPGSSGPVDDEFVCWLPCLFSHSLPHPHVDNLLHTEEEGPLHVPGGLSLVAAQSVPACGWCCRGLRGAGCRGRVRRLCGGQSCLDPDIAGGQLAVDEAHTPVRPGPSVEAVLVREEPEDVFSGEIDPSGNVEQHTALLGETRPVVDLQGEMSVLV